MTEKSNKCDLDEPTPLSNDTKAKEEEECNANYNHDVHESSTLH